MNLHARGNRKTIDDTNKSRTPAIEQTRSSPAIDDRRSAMTKLTRERVEARFAPTELRDGFPSPQGSTIQFATTVHSSIHTPPPISETAFTNRLAGAMFSIRVAGAKGHRPKGGRRAPVLRNITDTIPGRFQTTQPRAIMHAGLIRTSLDETCRAYGATFETEACSQWRLPGKFSKDARNSRRPNNEAPDSSPNPKH